ncbi:hypothetical protein SAMN06265379_10821 [Saccharicrinis carchari]|uniref:Endonuclease/exonuclease/phosphatase domain-containing protein n=1 Tax=Saccharicrinis carchari TaxID=1168039 RepID=A0A521E843_SACCC|nr:endonuclease/exonuclease/phosphatase family protein [Saccharicrinis carchari]SMO80125.1 hypothetical protein SAMN06265379_10821 [Saccharicrinis carchari]
MKQVLIVVVVSLCFIGCKCSSARQGQFQGSHVIAFYNLENLFDTINDPGIRDGEFTPAGSKEWSSERYDSKLINMAKVMADIGSDQGFEGPSIIGLCEMENRNVLEDLIKTKGLAHKNYNVVHMDSPDKRGIDVALLYNPDVFEVKSTHTYPLKIYNEETGNRIFTRDQLLVSGRLQGDKIHIIVNHWPSRYGGRKSSIPFRKEAALLNRHIIDSLLSENKHAKIITMGDLNDDPTDESIAGYLRAHAKRDQLKKGDLYNPLAVNFSKGKGTLFYRGKWNLFDQIVISQGWLRGKKGFGYDSAYIYKKPYLIQQEGNYKGYLLRTYGGKDYLNGYSDHLPVYMVVSAN